MEKQRNRLEVPGSYFERFVALIWNGVVWMLWVAVVAFWQEYYPPWTKYDFTKLKKRSGQTAILTGATRGVGRQVLKKLLQLDYQVIFGARNVDAGLKVINEIRQEGVQSGHVKCMQLNLASLKSVKTFAENVLNDTDRIDVLINNAAIMMAPYNVTEDGFEEQFQTNYLSHFYLTQLLLPKLKATATGKSTNCRVVNVSSAAHLASSAGNLKDIHNPKVYCNYRAYYDSKLSQVLQTKYQDAQLKSEGANVNFYVIHPGSIVTDLYVNLNPVVQTVMRWLKNYVRSPDGGAEMVMYAVISPDLEGNGGHYIVNKQIGRANSVADDVALQKFLWTLSEGCIRLAVNERR